MVAFPGHGDQGPLLVNASFPHLRLTDWPFSVVPQPDSCDYIANRDHLRSDIQELVDALSRRNVSNIHIFWAWFGAGKTHSMYFIRNLALQEHDSFGRLRGLVPVYSEFPREPTGFLDVYRTFSSAIDLNLLRDSFFELSTGKHADTFGARLRSVSIDLHNALHTLATGEDSNRAIAERWLRGQRLPVAEFRKAGISGHISSVEQAITTFPKIIEVLAQARQALGARVGRVVWLLDEFQRIAGAAPKVLREINNGLHSAFNACPAGLTLILSFSGTPEKELPSWFSPELRDRIGVTKAMVLPPMNRDSAMTFVRDVLRRYRSLDDADTDPYFPFTLASCQSVVAWLAEHGELKPRSIMQAFDQVLGAADLDIERGRISHIGRDLAEGVLADRIAVGGEGPE